jgi:hypothetical protein
MRSRLTCALFAALLLLLSPAAALAQGAGSDQYEDPFAEEPTQAPPPQQPAGGGPGAPGAGAGAAAGQAPAPATAGAVGAAPTAAAPTAPAPSAQPATTAPRLPATGADAVVIALVGRVVLLAGAGIRLRLRGHERRTD